MYQVTLRGIAQPTSCLGMGCASLGSRVSPARGTEALAQAYAAGVRWYDVAPAYGGGEAEALLGAFLKGRRGSVQICTKVGLVPPASSGAIRAIRNAARPVVAAARPLRTLIRRSGATANRQVDLSPDLLRGSLERSLHRLGSDHVDLYALHNANSADLERDEIRATLEALVDEGKTRAIAVAGSAATAAQVIAAGAPIGVVQFAQPPAHDPAMEVFAVARAKGIGCVTHSVFGVSGALQALSARLKADPALVSRLAQAGFDGPPAAAAASLLLARARAVNPDGVVLASMFSQRSLSANIAAAQNPPDAVAAALCADLNI